MALSLQGRVPGKDILVYQSPLSARMIIFSVDATLSPRPKSYSRSIQITTKFERGKSGFAFSNDPFFESEKLS
jgi:hypothetical protein